MMDSLRAFIVRWRPWIIGAGVLLIADMYNSKDDTKTASASVQEPTVERTASAAESKTQSPVAPHIVRPSNTPGSAAVDPAVL